MRRVPLLFALLALVSCEPESPVQPAVPELPGPALAILDGSREGGNPGFHWQPPIVRDAYEPTGEFARELYEFLTVEICEWDGTACVGDLIRTFSTTATDYPDYLYVNEGEQRFVAYWNADIDNLDKDAIYRVSVKAGPVELGYADVDPIREYHDLYDIDRDEFAVTADSYTMPIAFTIEEGTVFLVGSDGGTIVAAGGAVTLDVPPDALAEPHGISVRPADLVSPGELGLVPGTIFDLGPEGTAFDELAQLTIRYDEQLLPAGITEADLILLRGAEDGLWDEVDLSVVDEVAKTVTAPIGGFSSWAVGCRLTGTVDPASVTLAVGESVELVAEAACAGAPITGRRLYWSTFPSNIATIAPPRSGTSAVLEALNQGETNVDLSTSVCGFGIGPRILNSVCTADIKRIATAPVTVTEPEPDAGPDLILTALTVPTFTPEAIEYCWTIQNVGSEPAPLDGPSEGDGDNVALQAYLSVDGTLDSSDGPAGREVVGSSPLGSLAPGEVRQGCWVQPLGDFVTLDPYRYVGMVVDIVDVVDESDESNNSIIVALPEFDEAPGLRFVSLDSDGQRLTCGVVAVGDAYCWGSDVYQLGRGNQSGLNPDHELPGLVDGGNQFDAAYVGGLMCGSTPMGGALCWGGGSSIPVGDGTGQGSLVPVAVTGGLTFGSLDVGDIHACGVAGTSAYCWGAGGQGQLGTGAATPTASVPTLVAGGHAFASVFAGAETTCAITTSADAYCWGAGASGQLGNGMNTATNPTPQLVSGELMWASLSLDDVHTCGVTTDGDAYCWGINSGPAGSGWLGTGGGATNVPMPVAGGLKFASISTGTRHTCGVRTNGEIYCWGQNEMGQLGDGSLVGRGLPTAPVAGEFVWSAVAAGATHTCGLTTDGSAYCWGGNLDGELGTGSGPGSTTPVPVAPPLDE